MRPTAAAFTETELRQAREAHGKTHECPRCGVVADIDEYFGWRRMKPGLPDIRPQAWCLKCRGGKNGKKPSA